MGKHAGIALTCIVTEQAALLLYGSVLLCVDDASETASGKGWEVQEVLIIHIPVGQQEDATRAFH